MSEAAERAARFEREGCATGTGEIERQAPGQRRTAGVGPTEQPQPRGGRVR